MSIPPQHQAELQRLLRAADPAAGLSDLPPPVTAEQIRRRTEATAHYRAKAIIRRLTGRPLRRYGPRSTVPSTLATILTVIAITGGAVWMLQPRPPDSTTTAGPALRPLPPAAPTRDAETELITLANRIKQQPDTSHNATVRTQQWDHTWPSTPDGFLPREVLVWHDHEGTHTQSIDLPPQAHGTPAAPPAASPPPGSQASIKIVPGTPPLIPVDPAELAVNLTHSGGTRIIAAIARNVKQQHLSTQQRVAVLKVIASIHHLHAHGITSDRLDRLGFTYSTLEPATGIRDVIIIDPTTGTLLSWEQTTTTATGDRILAYTLYLPRKPTPSP